MRIRTLLELARIPNLPTVWSNITAVALLQSEFQLPTFIWAMTGGCSMYFGGMILNDVFDVKFDQEFRPERPIPSGRAGFHETLTLGFIFLLGGMVMLLFLSPMLALLLAVLILIYDKWHKNNPVSPLLMGLCRATLICLAASAFGNLAGSTLHAASIAIYIVGISMIAKNESKPEAKRSWVPTIFLLSAFLPVICNSSTQYGDIFRWLILSLALLPLLAHRLRPSGIGALVSGLLAAIPLLDCWNLPQISASSFLLFSAFSISAIFLRRLAPAT